MMKVKVSKLKLGYLITEDVKGLTATPIVPKNTTVTKEIKQVLEAFLVDEVYAEPLTSKIQEVKEEEKKTKEQASKHKESTKTTKNIFQETYLQVVKQYKKEFINWQSGLPIDINNIRNSFLPLFTRLEKEPTQILQLQNYFSETDMIYHHAVSMGLISGYIGRLTKQKSGDAIQIAIGGCLCDAGLAKENPVLLKQALMNGNMKLLNKHPAESYKMVQNVLAIQPEIKVSVFQHHEMLDGSGYPLGLKSNKIHKFAKIFLVSDLYHNLITNPNNPLTPFDALEILRKDYFGKIDIEILDALTDAFRQLAINMHVRLSDHRTGRIVYIDTKNPTKPVIQVDQSEEIISLSNESDIYIIEIIHQ